MTAKDITLETYYSIFLDAARRYPATQGYDCKQPQTFRVLQLDHGAEIHTPAMGATLSDKDTPYFYSRSWERRGFTPNNITADFPLLTAFELSSDMPRGITQGGMKQMYFTEISILDQFQNKCDGKARKCENRSINQIYADTEVILLNVVNYLCGSVIAQVGDVTGVYNIKMLEHWRDCGEIDGYNVVHDIGGAIQSENKEARTTHVEMAATGVYGTKIRLRLPVYRCLDVQFGALNCVEPINQFQGC